MIIFWLINEMFNGFSNKTMKWFRIFLPYRDEYRVFIELFHLGAFLIPQDYKTGPKPYKLPDSGKISSKWMSGLNSNPFYIPIYSNICCEWILVHVFVFDVYYTFIKSCYNKNVINLCCSILIAFLAKHWTYRSTYISEYEQHTLTPIKEFRDI